MYQHYLAYKAKECMKKGSDISEAVWSPTFGRKSLAQRAKWL